MISNSAQTFEVVVLRQYKLKFMLGGMDVRARGLGVEVDKNEYFPRSVFHLLCVRQTNVAKINTPQTNKQI